MVEKKAKSKKIKVLEMERTSNGKMRCLGEISVNDNEQTQKQVERGYYVPVVAVAKVEEEEKDNG
jgi:hypothetical protein